MCLFGWIGLILNWNVETKLKIAVGSDYFNATGIHQTVQFLVFTTMETISLIL